MKNLRQIIKINKYIFTTTKTRSLVFSVSALLFMPPVFSETIYLEQDCTTLPNEICFNNATALSNWLWQDNNSRDPSSSNPVTVYVGEGTFQGSIACPPI